MTLKQHLICLRFSRKREIKNFSKELEPIKVDVLQRKMKNEKSEMKITIGLTVIWTQY